MSTLTIPTLSFAVSLALASSALAGEPALVEDSSSLERIVVTAERLDRRGVGGSIAFLDSAVLEEHAYGDVNRVLRQVPGLNIVEEEGFGIRPSIGIGGNVANTRNAMPIVLQQNIFAGYQGALLGAAAGYSHILPFPTTINATDGHMGLAQPGFVGNHVVSGELSLTTRFAARSSLFFALRLGGMKTHLMHLDIDKHRWFFILGLNAGWTIDLGQGRRRRQQTP